MGNPYATPPANPGRAPGYATHIWGGAGRYSVPGVEATTDPEYTTGFSPTLKSGGSSDGSQLPDNVRIDKREPPVGENYNDPEWQARQNSEGLRRHQDDETREMWKVRQAKVPAPHVPLWTQERAPTRPTATNSPTGYAFQRPWHIPRNVNDVMGPGAVSSTGASLEHFSLADHRRRYEILGMKPQGRMGVNSYRATPRPWDEQLFIAPEPPARQSTITGTRSFRLGG
jgi:hypothetical protein